MVMDYTEKMRKYSCNDTNSKHINACKEYIYSHIKERITIEDLSDELGVSSGYPSRLFIYADRRLIWRRTFSDSVIIL